MKRFTDAGEYIALGNAAGFALVNGCSQPGKFGLVLLFLVLQRPQRCTHHFAGVLVPSALDLRQHKRSSSSVKFTLRVGIAARLPD
jgi:hypothetical protein